jgi:antitoxin component of MazEF toxin-antitoxin module
MKLPIKKAKIWKSGNSAVITIPMYLLENNHLTLGKEYDFEVEVDE